VRRSSLLENIGWYEGGSVAGRANARQLPTEVLSGSAISSGEVASGEDAAAVRDNLADRIRRQIRLRQESCCGTGRDELCDVARRVGRDQDDQRRLCAIGRGKQLGKLEAALVTERHVDKDDVRPQLGDLLDSLSRCAGYAQDALSLPLEYAARDISE
jgi:hypothetical protein